MNIPVDLKKAIHNDELIVFAGAGLSYDLYNINDQKVKGWENLVWHILDHLEKEGYIISHLVPLLKIYDPLTVLYLIEKDRALSRDRIYGFIERFLDLKNDKNKFAIHKLIGSLSDKIITTNYDNAFELADPIYTKRKAYKGKNYELTRHKDQSSKFLFKLHGCNESKESLVLFPSNYRDLYENNEKDAEHSLLVLKNIVYNNSLLFIGAGMGDFQINNIFKEIKRLQGDYNQRHFIITRKELDSSLNFLTPIYIDDYSQIETFLQSLNDVKEENHKNSGSVKVKELQGQLTEANDRIVELESKLNESMHKDQLLEPEAVKYFEEGLELSNSGHYEKAIEKYITSVALKPDFYEALNNWGANLIRLAKNMEEMAAEKQYKSAFDKYERALAIKPDFDITLNNWATALTRLAKMKRGEEAKTLFLAGFRKYEETLAVNPDREDTLFNWGTALGNFALLKDGKEAEKLYRESFEKLEQATLMNANKDDTWYNWGTHLGNLAALLKGKEAEDLYEASFDKFERSLAIKPDKSQALYNWGTNLGRLAMLKGGEDAKKLYRASFDKFEKALEVEPHKDDALYNWGTHLGNLASLLEGKEAETLFRQSFDKFERVLAIRPNQNDAIYNWGINLGNLANIKEGDEAAELYKAALGKFEKLQELEPDKDDVLFNIGTQLGNLAFLAEGKEAEDLLAASFKKYERALEINPNLGGAHYNWGTALLNLSKGKEEKEAVDLRNKAKKKLIRATELGAGHYNLACLYAMEGDKAKALNELDISLKNREISPSFVEGDPDWENYKGDTDFKALIDKHST